jgi:hypothetical protein
MELEKRVKEGNADESLLNEIDKKKKKLKDLAEKMKKVLVESREKLEEEKETLSRKEINRRHVGKEIINENQTSTTESKTNDYSFENKKSDEELQNTIEADNNEDQTESQKENDNEERKDSLELPSGPQYVRIPAFAESAHENETIIITKIQMIMKMTNQISHQKLHMLEFQHSQKVLMKMITIIITKILMIMKMKEKKEA